MIRSHTIYDISCDQCSAVAGLHQSSERAVENAVLRRGWLRRQIHYTGIIAYRCPACAKLPAPDWWPEEDDTV